MGMDADVRRAVALHRREQLGDAVDIVLAPDQTDIGVGRRLGQQMLAAAETDFEPDLAFFRKERRQIHRPSLGIVARGSARDGDIRQIGVHQRLLAAPQLVAAATAIEVAAGVLRPGALVFRHAVRSPP